jgi:hypothetical protein
MDEYIQQIHKQLNIVETNKDLPDEISQKKLEIRNEAIKKMENMLSDIKQKIELMESYYKRAVNINKQNNEKTIIKFSNVENNIMNLNINGLKLHARKIEFLEEAGPDLCFIPKLNRFCIRIAGNTFLGNIGEIYDTLTEPKRVKECRYYNKNKNTKCFKDNYECSFYHNPLYTSLSSEPRNFFSSFGYYLAGSDNNYLRFGNRSTLQKDISVITDDECSRFEDFTMHLLLCLIVLKNNRKF